MMNFSWFYENVRKGCQRVVEASITNYPYLINRADEDGWTPLLDAAAYGKLGMAMLLLRAGAEPNAELQESGESVLHLACEGGGEDMDMLVELLLDVYHIHPDQKTVRLTTPLMLAVKHGQEKSVKLLLSHGADVHCKSYSGHCALSYAISTKRPSLVKLLLQAGANVTDRHSHEAKLFGYDDILSMLQESEMTYQLIKVWRIWASQNQAADKEDKAIEEVEGEAKKEEGERKMEVDGEGEGQGESMSPSAAMEKVEIHDDEESAGASSLSVSSHVSADPNMVAEPSMSDPAAMNDETETETEVPQVAPSLSPKNIPTIVFHAQPTAASDLKRKKNKRLELAGPVLEMAVTQLPPDIVCDLLQHHFPYSRSRLEGMGMLQQGGEGGKQQQKQKMKKSEAGDSLAEAGGVSDEGAAAQREEKKVALPEAEEIDQGTMEDGKEVVVEQKTAVGEEEEEHVNEEKEGNEGDVMEIEVGIQEKVRLPSPEDCNEDRPMEESSGSAEADHDVGNDKNESNVRQESHPAHVLSE